MPYNKLVSFLVFIIYVLYCNTYKKKASANFYSYVFSAVVLGLGLLLSYTTLYIFLNQLGSYQLPIIFSIIFLLIIMCVSSYDKFLSIIDENTKYKIQLELDKMQEEYSAQLDEKLNELHSLRHDMKNHLIVIDGYAKQEKKTAGREPIAAKLVANIIPLLTAQIKSPQLKVIIKLAAESASIVLWSWRIISAVCLNFFCAATVIKAMTIDQRIRCARISTGSRLKSAFQYIGSTPQSI